MAAQAGREATVSRELAVLRWEEPPPSLTAGAKRPEQPVSKWAAIARELAARPGDWAVIFEGRPSYATSLASNIRYGQLTAFAPAGDFDATSRLLNGKRIVYARYLGDGQP